CEIKDSQLNSSDGNCMLECAARVKMIEEIAFVRLIPTHLVRRQRTDVQAIDARRVDEGLNQFRIFGDRGDNERWSKLMWNLILGNFYDAGEWEQKLLHREWMILLAKQNCRQQVRTVVPRGEPSAIAISGGNV